MRKLRGNPFTQADELSAIIGAILKILEMIEDSAYTHGQKKGFAIMAAHMLNKFEREMIEYDPKNEIPF